MDTPELIRQAKEAGYTFSFLQKPLHPTELVAALRKLQTAHRPNARTPIQTLSKLGFDSQSSYGAPLIGLNAGQLNPDLLAFIES